MPSFDIGQVVSVSTTALSVTYTSLRREIGRYLGIGRDTADWTADEITDVNDIIKSGLRRFYWPTVESKVIHQWSFLTPVSTLNLTVGTSVYSLPPDFGGMATGLTYGSDTRKRRVEIATEEHIRSLYSGSSGILSAPVLYAIRAKPFTEGGETSYEIVLYPSPDAAYVLTYRYSVIPGSIGSGSAYPHGGSQHAETIRAACLAAAEETLNDEIGIHGKRFQECLMSSIQTDRNQFGLKTTSDSIQGVKTNDVAN